MPAGPETKLVNKIRKAIKKEWPQSFVVKVHGGPYQQAGIPDLWVIIEGHAILLEVKAQRDGESEEHARGRATPTQLATIDALRRAGATAEVVLSVEESLLAVRHGMIAAGLT